MLLVNTTGELRFFYERDGGVRRQKPDGHWRAESDRAARWAGNGVWAEHAEFRRDYAQIRRGSRALQVRDKASLETAIAGLLADENAGRNWAATRSGRPRKSRRN